MPKTVFSLNRALRACLLLTAALAALPLVGCRDNEPERRAAFIEFLDTKIVNKKGVSLPELTDAEKNAFGDYADHYAILQRFQKTMSEEAASNAREMLALAELEDLAAVAEEERSLRKAASEAEKLRARVLELRAKADAGKAKLAQPEDLVRAYSAAYGKIVTAPAEASAAAFDAVGKVFEATLALLDFINAHSRDLEISGKSINVRNPALMGELNEKLDAVRGRASALRKAYAAMMGALLQ